VTGDEAEIGTLNRELATETCKDVCRSCSKAITDAMGPVEAKARKELLEPMVERFKAAEEAAEKELEAEEKRIHQELVIPAGRAALNGIRVGNGLQAVG
jgi:hypothetical protein